MTYKQQWILAILGAGALTYALVIAVTMMKKEQARIKANYLSETGELKTIRHDGHLFVTRYSGGLIHHPSCPCLK